jgi:hypothetical protein
MTRGHLEVLPNGKVYLDKEEIKDVCHIEIDIFKSFWGIGEINVSGTLSIRGNSNDEGLRTTEMRYSYSDMEEE